MSSSNDYESAVAEEKGNQYKSKLVAKISQLRKPEKRDLRIDNIVCTFSLFDPALRAVSKQILDLRAVANVLRARLGDWEIKRTAANAFSTDQRFPSCVSRCRETATTNSIFASGVVVIGGAKAKGVALMSAHLLAFRIHRDIGLWNASVANFKVCNVVSSFGLGYRLNLHKLYKEHRLKNDWNPEEFRGMTWKHCKVSFVLFETGMAVATGARTFAALKSAFASAQEILKDFEYDDRIPREPDERIERAKSNRSRHPVAKRKAELYAKSCKKQEAQYLQKLREKYKDQPDRAVTGQAPKKRRRLVAPAALPTSTTTTSFRWQAIDSQEEIRKMMPSLSASTNNTPTAKPKAVLMLQFPGSVR